jgi:anti-sigma factor RsiW
MILSDETLMAYVDGELACEARTAVDSAIASDAEMAQWIAPQQALRTTSHSAVDAALLGPLPPCLVNTARSVLALGATTKLTAIVSARAARATSRAGTSVARASSTHWGTISASALVDAAHGRGWQP